MRKKGFFLTFEGTDGVGKSTQVFRLADWLTRAGYTVRITREPGGGKVAEKIRKILLDPSLKMDRLTELFLYEAARIEHINEVVKPALETNTVLICDRFTDSTVAYQGHARGLLKEVAQLNRVATQGIRPDLTLLLSLPPKQGLAKAISRGAKGGDRLEKEGLPFQQTVAKGFLTLQKEDPARVKLVRVQSTIEKTHEIIRKIVSKELHAHFGTRPR